MDFFFEKNTGGTALLVLNLVHGVDAVLVLVQVYCIMTAFSDATIAGGIGIVYHYFGGVAVVCMGFRDLHAQTYWPRAA